MHKSMCKVRAGVLYLHCASICVLVLCWLELVLCILLVLCSKVRASVYLQCASVYLLVLCSEVCACHVCALQLAHVM